MAKKVIKKKSKSSKKSLKPKLKKRAVAKKITKKSASAKKRPAKAPKPDITQNMVLIGEVTHYFPHVKVGVINLKGGELVVGDVIFIKGHTTKFKQKISSLQINHIAVDKIKKGDDAGLLVKSRVRIGDSVYKV